MVTEPCLIQQSLKYRLSYSIFFFELMRWKATCLMYTELSIYTDCVKSIKTHVWWFLARKRPYLIYKISALLSVCMGNEPKGMKCEFRRRLCFLCNTRQPASPKHILFECESFSSTRSSKLKVIIDSMPNGMRSSFMEMNLNEKTTLLLSGLHCNKYIEEWSQLLINICDFVYEIYRQRKIKFDDMLELGIT